MHSPAPVTYLNHNIYMLNFINGHYSVLLLILWYCSETCPWGQTRTRRQGYQEKVYCA